MKIMDMKKVPDDYILPYEGNEDKLDKPVE